MTGALTERDHATAMRCAARSVRPIAVTHVITTLSTGGAEMMLYRLLRSMNRERFANSVISLSGGGSAAEKIRALNLPVKTLDLGRRNGLGIFQLARELRSQRPDLVQTWMYHADLLGGLASLTLPRVPVLWNIRCGGLDPTIDKRRTMWISRACALASGILPTHIISCSERAGEFHAVTGYARKKIRVIPNGFDTDEFRPSARDRLAVRKELGIPQDTLLIGLAARFDRAKDHATFFEAAGQVHAKNPGVQFLLCGDKVTHANLEISAAAAKAGVEGSSHLLGPREDMPQILAALDIAVSSSVVEGFPNALGEAMSCGVPCVATDAGDSRRLLGDTGILVPVRNAAALASGILRLVDLYPHERVAMGALARRRILERFSIASAARQYEQIYEESLGRCAA